MTVPGIEVQLFILKDHESLTHAAAGSYQNVLALIGELNWGAGLSGDDCGLEAAVGQDAGSVSYGLNPQGGIRFCHDRAGGELPMVAIVEGDARCGVGPDGAVAGFDDLGYVEAGETVAPGEVGPAPGLL